MSSPQIPKEFEVSYSCMDPLTKKSIRIGFINGVEYIENIDENGVTDFRPFVTRKILIDEIDGTYEVTEGEMGRDVWSRLRWRRCPKVKQKVL